jgi:ATP-dependent helicase/nuclease subunit A
MRWTSEQREAIESGGNLIVSAAAGAGKTAVLTERVVSRIMSGTAVENMLVLTFTRAAAAEMKARIASRLNELAGEQGDGKTTQYLRRQARAVESAYISTIHAFCARVLRRHYHAVGLPAQSRTADDMESAALIETVRDEFLTALSVREDTDYQTLLAAFGGEDQAWGAVMQTYRFTRAQPDPDGWLDAAGARYGDEAALLNLMENAVAFAKREITLALEPVASARDTLPPAWDKAIAALDDDLTRCRALQLCKSYDEYREALSTIAFSRMSFPRGTAEAEKKPIQAARQAEKDLIRTQIKRFTRPQKTELDILRRSGEAVRALVSIVKQFEAAYAAAKRAAGLQDYDDLEHFTLEALFQDAVAREYRDRFEWIAVDEYQDSNRVQEEIVRRIARKDNLFFVGDVKQSIYRFRQAEPKLFLEKLAFFSGEIGKRIDLTRNFRSSGEVLTAVNEVFAAILNADSGGIEYDERAKLACGENPPEGSAEAHFVRRGRAETEDGEDALEDAADLEVEARLIAGRIREIIKNETYFDSKTGRKRAYRYSDFAVLLRTGSGAQSVAQTLSQSGIPSYAQSGGGYFDAVEVQIFRNLLRVIDNRRQDVPLISVLCSSIGNFTFEELARVRAAHRGGSFFEAFAACAAQDETALGKRAKDFFETLGRYRAESRLVSVEELVGKLLDETGFYEEMGAGVNGAQRQANLNALLDKAHAFEQAGARGVWNFLHQIDLAENNASVGAAQTLAADVVRILTIHKSKGLEFPVVFVAGLGKRFNMEDMRKSLLLHAEDGIALRFIDREAGGARVKRDTVVRRTLAERVKTEQLGEEMRVLYVAMTRAKRKLILTACMDRPEEKRARAPERPFAWQVLRCSGMAQWLLMGSHRALALTVHEREPWLAGEKAERSAELPPAVPETLTAIRAKLDWKYPFAEAVLLNAKAAVSRLGRDEAERPAFAEPAFLGVKKSAVFGGTATHAAMQYLPLEKKMDQQGVAAYLTKLAQSGKITPEQAEAVDKGAVEWFTHTPLASRMRQAERLERELAFSYAIAANALYGEAVDTDERVLLQGVMDACFLEGGAWTIVDYKTDRVRPGESAADAAKRHALQLRLYAAALEALSKRTVKQKLIVLLSHREIVEI